MNYILNFKSGVNLKNIVLIGILIGFSSAISIYIPLFLSLSLLAVFLVLFIKVDSSLKTIIFFLLLFLPFYAFLRSLSMYYNISPISNSINYMRSFLILIGVVLLVVKSKATLSSNKSDKLIDYAVLILLFNYTIGLFISLIWGNFELALKGINLSVMPIMLYFLAKNVKINFFIVEKMYQLILATGLVASFSGIYFYFYKPYFFGELLQIFRVVDEDVNVLVNYSRMVGIFLSPNVFGVFMAINLMISLFMIIFNKNKFIYITIFLFCFTGLVLSLSRGSWIFVLVSSFVIVLLAIRHNVIRKKIYLFSIIILVAFFSLFKFFEEYLFILNGRLTSLFSLDNESSYGRVENWLLYFDKLKLHPEGYGLGVGSQAMTGNLKVIEETGINVIDGFYSKTIIETGYFGICLVLCAYVIIIVSLTRRKSLSLNQLKISSLTLVLFSGMLAQQFGSNILDFVAISPYFWILLGLCNNHFLFPKEKVNEGRSVS